MVIKIYGRFLQYMAAISVSILCGNVGMGVSWPSPVLPELYSDHSPIGEKVTQIEGSWVVTFLLLGSVCGSLILGVAIDYLGRKGSLLWSSVPIFASWVMLMFARSVIVLYIARFVQGFFIAVPVAIAFTYVGEVSEPKLRGKLSMYCMMLMEGGSIISVIAGAYLPYKILALISSLVPVLFFITFFFMPESPYYYIRKGNVDKAELSLKRFRGVQNVSDELKKMQVNIEESMNSGCSSFELISDPVHRRPLLIVLGLKVLQQFSGTIAIQSYMKPIFEEAATGIDSDISSIICLAVPFPTMFLASYLIDTFGRKPLYYVSTIGYTIAMLCEVVYFFMKDTNNPYVDNIAWLPVLGIFLSYIFKCLGVSNLSYLLLSELFAPNVKGAAASVCQIFGSLLSALVTLGFPAFSSAFGTGTSFLVFSVCCFGGFLFIWFFLPETKGKSLCEIQDDIKDDTPTRY